MHSDLSFTLNNRVVVVMVLLCQAVPDKTVVDAALLFAVTRPASVIVLIKKLVQVAKNKIAAAQCLIQRTCSFCCLLRRVCVF